MVAQEKLTSLPNWETLLKLTQSLAMLDSIMHPDWVGRYSSFNSKWGDEEQLATMRTGGGDEYFVFFNRHGAIIKGFDHESEMNVCDEPEEVWQGVLDEVPAEFAAFLEDAAFPREYTTFCLWYLNRDAEWKTGKIEYPNGDAGADGSGWLLFLLDGAPETYCEWATDYYERDIDFETVKKIYEHTPLTEEMAITLNPNRSFEELREDVDEIAYSIVAN